MNPKKIKTHWNEQWVSVPTKAPTKNSNYEISNYGRIKSISKETGDESILRGSKMTGGLNTLNMHLREDKTQATYIHKFVAEHFVERDDLSKVFPIHLDNNKNNNYYKNLKWVDQAGLTKWQKEIGVFDEARRLKTGQNKLTETKVRLIKKRLKTGKTKMKIIAKTFDISLTHLKRIESGENWGHISI